LLVFFRELRPYRQTGKAMKAQAAGLSMPFYLPGIFGRVWRRIQDDDCFDLAAQISFYFVLSLFPFCLVLAVIVGWLPSSALWKSFATWIVTYLPADSRQLIFSTILGLVSYSKGFLSFGLLVTLWSASAGFVSLMESLSVAYGSKDTRSYWRKHVVAACVTMLAAVFAIAAFGIMALGHWGSERLVADVGAWSASHTFWEIARRLATIALIYIGINLTNYILPNVRRPWRWLTPGTVFATVALISASAALNLYFRHFSSYPRLYGTLGGFIVLMFWVYVASVILLIGAEIDHVVEDGGEERIS
jgi:membrane protein